MSFLGKLAYQASRIRDYGLVSEYYRTFKASEVWQLPPARCADSSEVTIHSVGGHDYLTMFAAMLHSWIHSSGISLAVRYHDDGSLTDEDAANLRNSFPGIKIIGRAEADEQMEARLSEAPLLKAYRDAMPHALKCVDALAMTPGARVLLLDPDIIFFRKPEFILNWISDENDTQNWFNKDPFEPSPYSAETSSESFGFPIWNRVNSGLCLINTELLDIAFFEQVFKDSIFQNSPDWRKEQTLLALSASRTNTGGLLPCEYDVTLARSKADSAICRHYVGRVRHHFWREGLPHVLNLSPR